MTPYGTGVACITVSYYSTDALLDLLASLRTSTVPLAQTIVVNNAVDDDLRAVREQPGVAVIDAGRNAGYGGAVNLGAQSLADSVGWILVANPDTLVEPGTIGALLAAADSPHVGSLGPRVTDDDGVTYPSARELPSLRTGIGHALFANPWPTNPWSSRYRGDSRAVTTTTRETGWLSGSFVLVRREAFEQLGGFDTSFFMYFEDVDLGRRLGEAGWTNLYVTDATVVHHGAHSTKRSAKAMNRAHHESAYRYLAHKYSAWWLWPLRAALRVALTIREWSTRRRPLG
ncbi:MULTISPECIES: glycosyltransferase family 2 protein [unclassified Salinibacterium]|uniref:glycosyltransferase family 2 protein n=1 Tax=unclassified Salinibacterium TaxID=2632331 RepID=UPI001422AEF6|nr:MULTISPECIES: glycosyltransferase family 2 protein [unclassified Salinibacterium]